MNVYVKNKWVYGVIGITIVAIIVWIIVGTKESEYDNKVMVNQETYTMESAVQESSEEQSETVNGYYMVKAIDETVKVYWIDGAGEHLHKETTIAYPLLSLEDQKLLDEGIKLDTDEELAGFLENYDS